MLTHRKWCKLRSHQRRLQHILLRTQRQALPHPILRLDLLRLVSVQRLRLPRQLGLQRHSAIAKRRLGNVRQLRRPTAESDDCRSDILRQESPEATEPQSNLRSRGALLLSAVYTAGCCVRTGPSKASARSEAMCFECNQTRPIVSTITIHCLLNSNVTMRRHNMNTKRCGSQEIVLLLVCVKIKLYAELSFSRGEYHQRYLSVSALR